MYDVGQSYTQQLAAAINEGKRLRIVGDNVNYAVGIRDQRSQDNGKTQHLHHAFSSIALIHDVDFAHLSSERPQKPWTDVNVQDLLMNQEDYQALRQDYINQIVTVAKKHIPYFKFLEDISAGTTTKTGENHKKTTVIPLETVMKNEMYYSDVVDILDSYENIVETTFNAAGKEVTDDVKIHIGGDQLTRERFSGAKGLRAAENNVKNRFGHLTPVTFEMFHLLMNFLQGFFDFLYSDKSAGDLGTLKCEINRVMRSQVDQDVKKAYDADKDFVIAFVNAYIVELVCERFGMEDHLSVPTKNIPPEFSSVEEKKTWMNEVIGKLVDEMVWPKKIADIQNDVIGKHKYIM